MTRTAEERLAQWDRTVRVFGRLWEVGRLGNGCRLGFIVQNTARALEGDHVLITPMNGDGERQPVYAVTGKGVHLRRCFMQYSALKAIHQTGKIDRWKAVDHGPLRFVACPDELVGLPPFDPVVRRLVEARVRAMPRSG